MLSRTLAVFVSGCTVYAFMACSGGGSGNGASDNSSGAPGEASVPGINNPVPNAAADPTSGSRLNVESTGGSRLKVEILVGEDGSKQVSGWFDTQRNESCTFTAADDGATRCLPPLDTNVRANNLGYSIYTFVDAACSERAFYAAKDNSCAARPRGKAFGYFEDTCGGGGPHVYTYGSAIDANAPLYFTTTPQGPCTPMTARRQATNVTFEGLAFFRGVAVPASSFVKATPAH